MSNNALYEYLVLERNGEKKRVAAKNRYLNATEIARVLKIYEPGTKKPLSHIVPKIMGLDSDYPRYYAEGTEYSLRVYTDEDGSEFVKRLVAKSRLVDVDKNVYRFADIDFVLDKASPLWKLLKERNAQK